MKVWRRVLPFVVTFVVICTSPGAHEPWHARALAPVKAAKMSSIFATNVRPGYECAWRLPVLDTY
jgi:hypothetical protein